MRRRVSGCTKGETPSSAKKRKASEKKKASPAPPNTATDTTTNEMINNFGNATAPYGSSTTTGATVPAPINTTMYPTTPDPNQPYGSPMGMYVAGAGYMANFPPGAYGAYPGAYMNASPTGMYPQLLPQMYAPASTATTTLPRTSSGGATASPPATLPLNRNPSLTGMTMLMPNGQMMLSQQPTTVSPFGNAPATTKQSGKRGHVGDDMKSPASKKRQVDQLMVEAGERDGINSLAAVAAAASAAEQPSAPMGTVPAQQQQLTPQQLQHLQNNPFPHLPMLPSMLPPAHQMQPTPVTIKPEPNSELPFVCDSCSKGFTSKSSLSNHKLTHTDRYACQQCGRRTASSAHLRIHLAMHEKEREKMKAEMDNDIMKQINSTIPLNKQQQLQLQMVTGPPIPPSPQSVPPLVMAPMAMPIMMATPQLPPPAATKKRKAAEDAADTKEEKVKATKAAPVKKAATVKKYEYEDDDDEYESEEPSSDETDDEDFEATPPSASAKKGKATSKATKTTKAAASAAAVGEVSGGRPTLRQRHHKAGMYQEEEQVDEYAFCDCEWFVNEKSQPFKCEIDPLVPIVLDIHSHLVHTEVIGLLGGLWNEKTKVLRVLSAHACRTLATGNDHMNVELDPVSQIEVSEKIAALGQITVGWYHSHPIFRNDPSIIDVQNQMSYQSLFRGAPGKGKSAAAAIGVAPFVAAIITPFGRNKFRPLPSNIKWFSTITKKEKQRQSANIFGNSSKTSGVDKDKDGAYKGESRGLGKRAKRSFEEDDKLEVPMELWTSIQVTKEATAPSTYVTPDVDSLESMVDALIKEYSTSPTRVNFHREWVPNDEVEEEESEAEEEAAEKKAGEKPSKKAKVEAETKAEKQPTVKPSAYIKTKLDQFLHSLSGHILDLQPAAKKSSNLASSAPRTTNGLASSTDPETSRLVSPFFSALTPVQAKFVRHIMQQVESWKSKDDENSEPEVEEDEEEAEPHGKRATNQKSVGGVKNEGGDVSQPPAVFDANGMMFQPLFFPGGQPPVVSPPMVALAVEMKNRTSTSSRKKPRPISPSQSTLTPNDIAQAVAAASRIVASESDD